MADRNTAQITGGQRLIDVLVANGTTQVFCVPGESYLPVIEALRTAPIKTFVCRQESGAAMMAEAQGKLTGRPGICLVTRGPGATNAAAGIHIARQDSTPMILLIGQVERGFQDREAFQEIDFTKFFAPIAKWAAEIRDASRIDEYISRAFSVAMSGRPGPVVLSLPEDMLAEQITAQALHPAVTAQQALSEQACAIITQHLAQAKNPLLLLGGSTWDNASRTAIHTFAEKWKLPVSVSLRRQHLFDHGHPNFAGHCGIAADPALQERIKKSDLIVMIGGRLSEMPSQSYALLDIPHPKQKLVHIHPDPDELGRVYQPVFGVAARAADAAIQLEKCTAPTNVAWATEAASAHENYRQYITPQQNAGPVQMAELVLQTAALCPDDAIICNGAGNFASWVHRFYPFRILNTQLAPTSGSMGYGVPAAIAAKALFPHKTVVCFAGDGDVMMTVQELATAAQYGINIVLIVIDNGMYGTIRMHQEKHYPGYGFATDLRNPDFAALGKSFGFTAFDVRTTDAFAPALRTALDCGTPSLLHVTIDPEAITPTRSLSQIRADAQRA